MAGHAQLKFVMTECSKTQIRLTGLIFYIPYFFLVLVSEFEDLGVCRHAGSVDETAAKVTGEEGEVEAWAHT